MAEHNVKVLGFGDNVVDLYEHSHIMYPGGNCINLCAYSKIFGVERSAYMGYFGNDAIAEFVIGVMEEMGVEMVKCKQLEGENGWSKCTLIDGDRIFGDYNQGGVRGKTPYVLDRFDLEYMKQFDFVHTGNYCYTESELPKMKAAGIKVSFDFSDDSPKEYYEKNAPYVTYAFCSFDGSDEEAEEHLKFIHSLGPELCSLTRGSRGCMMYDGEQFYLQPAKIVDKVRDTMGAGDSFLTTFMDSYIDRLKAGTERPDAIRAALEDAAEFAAMNVSTFDGAFGHGRPYTD
jgi:sugar/nucleoside kinase (ribokinase family)